MTSFEESPEDDENQYAKPYEFEEIIKDSADIIVEKEFADISIKNLLKYYSDEITTEDNAASELESDPEYVKLMKDKGLYHDDIEYSEQKSKSMKETESLSYEFLEGTITPETLAALKTVITHEYNEAMSYIQYHEGVGKYVRESFPEIRDIKKEYQEGTKYENILRDAKIAAAYLNTLK